MYTILDVLSFFELSYDFLLLKFMFYKPVSLCGRQRQLEGHRHIIAVASCEVVDPCANTGQKNVQQRYIYEVTSPRH